MCKTNLRKIINPTWFGALNIFHFFRTKDLLAAKLLVFVKKLFMVFFFAESESNMKNFALQRNIYWDFCHSLNIVVTLFKKNSMSGLLLWVLQYFPRHFRAIVFANPPCKDRCADKNYRLGATCGFDPVICKSICNYIADIEQNFIKILFI